jgi:DNA polymerase IIIc chi subunit
MSGGQQVCFLKVSDMQTKVGRITAVIHQHYQRGDKILIRVDNGAAETFLDDLLWTTPEASYLPHVVTHSHSDAHVVITTATRNLNAASVLVNLGAHAAASQEGFSTIYDLADISSAEKQQLAHARYLEYQRQRLPLSVI